MGQPNPFLPQPQQAPPAQPQYTQQPQQQQPNPYQQQPAAQPQQYQQQPQYGAPAANGGSPWPQGATAGAPGLVARPGQYVTPAPPSAGGGARPRPSDLQGRLLLILPEHVQRQVPSRFTNNGVPQLQDKLTATVIVLDGGPLTFGGQNANGQQQQQQPQTVNVPYVIKGMWIQQSKLIEQLEEALAMRQRGEAGLALGRLWKTGPNNNDPYVLAAPSPDDARLYDQYVSQVNPFTL